jgi:hypothetical protein
MSWSDTTPAPNMAGTHSYPIAVLRNRGLGALPVCVLPIALARRGAATACAAVQSTAPFFWGSRSWSALRIDGLSEIARVPVLAAKLSAIARLGDFE